MNERSIRLRIRKLLQSGRLPYDSAATVSERPSTGEVCSACGTVIADGQLAMEGVAGKRRADAPIRFHVLCFKLWNDGGTTRDGTSVSGLGSAVHSSHRRLKHATAHP